MGDNSLEVLSENESDRMILLEKENSLLRNTISSIADEIEQINRLMKLNQNASN